MPAVARHCAGRGCTVADSQLALYGDPLGQGLTEQTIDLRADPWTVADTVWLLSGWFQSFWGKFGGAGHIPLPSWVYWTLGAVSLLAIAGLVRGWFRFPVKYRPVVLLLVLATVSVAVGIWRYSLIALGTNQGRLLYPAVSAIVTLFVLGLAAWTPESMAHGRGYCGTGCVGRVGRLRTRRRNPACVCAAPDRRTHKHLRGVAGRSCAVRTPDADRLAAVRRPCVVLARAAAAG